MSCGGREWGGAKAGLLKPGDSRTVGFAGRRRWIVFRGEKMASPVAQALKASAYNAGDPGSIPGSGRSLEQEMATHSSNSAWKISWTEELGGYSP